MDPNLVPPSGADSSEPTRLCQARFTTSMTSPTMRVIGFYEPDREDYTGSGEHAGVPGEVQSMSLTTKAQSFHE